jgi:NAD(P)-dependent dehydrogenase (short-subunit alcohol dehydrogenase family)
MQTYANKVVIITGGASGIGRALGEELAGRKATVILADCNAELLIETSKSIRDSIASIASETLDVSDYTAVKKLVDETVKKHGRLDYIFNNAGTVVGGEVRDCSIDDWRKVIDVNLYGVVNGVSAAYPVMVKQGFGHIVNTASIEGLMPFPTTVSYAASKFGVVGLSIGLRIEAADLGVKVSVVCPGYIKTPIFYTCKMIKLDRDKAVSGLPERFALTPGECALEILKGVERNKAIIVVTRLARIMWWIQRLFPDFTLRHMQRELRKIRRDLRIEN